MKEFRTRLRVAIPGPKEVGEVSTKKGQGRE